MKPIRITKEQARKYMLSYQGLDGTKRFMENGSIKAGILSFVSQVGCIQYDPLNIAGHNQELVLQSRIDGFRPSVLQELLYKDRLLIDGWDKVMSIYCTGVWPYFSRYRAENLKNLGHEGRPVTPYLPLIRKEIEKHGPLSSLELEFDQTVNWPWGPTRVSRAALESMYFWGELIIHHKINTRKVYDFADRHLPKELLEAPDPNRTFEEYRDWRVYRRIGGVGLLWGKPGDAWLEIPETKTPQRLESIQRLTASGALAEVSVEGINVPFYLRSKDLPLLEEVLSVSSPALRTGASAPIARILAPLDNLLWDRRLIRELFDFDYRWEVYKPLSERAYGYYVLPVLYGDRFVARFEPGFDKKTRILVIKNWWWEKGIRPTKIMLRELTNCFRRFASFLDAKGIQPGEGLQSTVADWISNL